MTLLRLQRDDDDFNWREFVAMTKSLLVKLLIRVVPWLAVGVVVLIYVLPNMPGLPGTGLLAYMRDIRLLVSLLFVVTTVVGSVLISLGLRRESERALTIVSQEEITDSVLDSIGPGSTVNVLLYSGYSLLNRIEDYCRRNPRVLSAHFRFLVRDIDLAGGFPQPGMRQRRLNEIGVAIEKFRQFLSQQGQSEMRFYAADPWLRGVSVDGQTLWLSHYTNRKDAARDAGLREDDDAYSGLSTPWFKVARDRDEFAPRADHRESIKRFDSLFDMLWESATKNKYVVLDLDGTLFASDVLTRFFTETLPLRYFESLKATGLTQESADSLYERYKAACTPELSTTAALLRVAAEARTDGAARLTDYLAWKDQQLDQLAGMLPGPNPGLRAVLETTAKTSHLVLLTNHTTAFTDRVLDSMQLSDLFPETFRLTLDKTHSPKPDPALVVFLTCHVGLDLRRCVFVGDRPDVDLDYVRECSLARVSVNGPDALQRFLRLAAYPATWHSTRVPDQGDGYEWH